MSDCDVDKWVAPAWHSDFGCPDVEVEMLKAFCRALAHHCPDCVFALDRVEEGYMAVGIDCDGKKVAELHVVKDRDSHKYGMFGVDAGDEDKSYFADIQEGCSHFMNAHRPKQK